MLRTNQASKHCRQTSVFAAFVTLKSLACRWRNVFDDVIAPRTQLVFVKGVQLSDLVVAGVESEDVAQRVGLARKDRASPVGVRRAGEHARARANLHGGAGLAGRAVAGNEVVPMALPQQPQRRL